MTDSYFSPTGQQLLKYFEGLRLKAYQDIAGKWTIGYGHTGGVRPGMTITREQADILFWQDVGVCTDAIERNGLTLNQNAYDAIVCFIFNIGPGAFATSSPCAWLKRNNYERAAESMKLWNKSKLGEDGPLMVDKILVRRRELETRLLLGDIPDEAREP